MSANEIGKVAGGIAKLCAVFPPQSHVYELLDRPAAAVLTGGEHGVEWARVSGHAAWVSGTGAGKTSGLRTCRGTPVAASTAITRSAGMRDQE